jgi:hypothetical protein
MRKSPDSDPHTAADFPWPTSTQAPLTMLQATKCTCIDVAMSEQWEIESLADQVSSSKAHWMS